MGLLPRLHLFEIEDQPWCPVIVRDLATDYLHFLEAKFELHRPVVGLLGRLLRTTGATRVIDLCSGGGGPIPALQRALASEGLSVPFVLTDRFPNLDAFKRIEAQQALDGISFIAGAVDARAVPAELIGVRTLFNAFHHFRPVDAVAVLRDAANRGQPIGIFEIPDRTFRNSVSTLLLVPLVVMLTTPWIRPFRWSRLLWTYVVPLVPLICWWDGVVSQLRAYRVDELEQLAAAAGAHSYTWEAGRIPIASMPGSLTYLLGVPRQ
jgi:hypothetical protein